MRKLRSIKLKFLLSLIFVVLAIFIISNLLTHNITQTCIDRMEITNLTQWSNDFEIMVEPNFVPPDYPGLASRVEEVLKEKDGDFIILFDHQKKEILRKGITLDPGPLELDDRRIPQKVETAAGDFYVVSLAVKDQKSESPRGYILYGHSLKEQNDVIATIRNYILYSSALVFVLAIIFSSLIIKKITKPVDIIKKGLEMVSHGMMNYRITINTNDEYAFLAENFNKMAEQLEYMMDELESSHRDLENQVYHRTEALNSANEKLRQAMDELKYTQKRIIRTETQKSLTSIVSGFAHEINNPLTGILGYIDLMELNEPLSPYSKRRLEGIKDLALRIKDIIDELNQLDPEIEQTKMDINLSNLLEKLVKIIGKENEHTGILFETELLAEEVIVQGNHFALWQVFEGIVENAIEAITEKNKGNGSIRVTLKKSADDTFAVAEITDNGGGFENVDKAFNPFYTTKNRTQKKGIGLSIAFNLIQEHKGNISIRNWEDVCGVTGAIAVVHLPLHLYADLNPEIIADYTFRQNEQ